MVKRKSDTQKEGDPGPSTTEAASKPKKNRVHNSAVHQEYDQTETVNAEKKTVIRSVCKHCVPPKSQVFPHKQCSELKRHLKVCHPDVFKKVELLDLKQVEEKTEIPKSRLDVIQDTMNSWMNTAGLPMNVTILYSGSLLNFWMILWRFLAARHNSTTATRNFSRWRRE